ncbi:hypothetical protein G6L97_03690 [Agrobacterium tumefaciens]|uniref:hypothetical protein n=1 Tax=Agrobacterium TaxID=357 RepID=UPI0013E39A6A|nr:MULTISPECIES: hypothetical protein [Agrobacterium]NSY42660.1 hypothetical protein [Agrobacterium tumefaciens]NSZ83513.1 hypothetical protein [Agrobacterium tumefaciens]WCA69725.1 hypothetical protein G6L97_03690 [Agrobacterium tumefaciens]
MPEIHLSEQDERFIDEQVAAGVYSDADAGRVHRYASQDDFLSDIKRVSVQQKTGTGH